MLFVTVRSASKNAHGWSHKFDLVTIARSTFVVVVSALAMSASTRQNLALVSKLSKPGPLSFVFLKKFATRAIFFLKIKVKRSHVQVHLSRSKKDQTVKEEKNLHLFRDFSG